MRNYCFCCYFFSSCCFIIVIRKSNMKRMNEAFVLKGRINTLLGFSLVCTFFFGILFFSFSDAGDVYCFLLVLFFVTIKLYVLIEFQAKVMHSFVSSKIMVDRVDYCIILMELYIFKLTSEFWHTHTFDRTHRMSPFSTGLHPSILHLFFQPILFCQISWAAFFLLDIETKRKTFI